MDPDRTTPETGNPHLSPDLLVKEFRERSEALDVRLDALQEMIQAIRGEFRAESGESLSQLAQAAQDMANGIVYQQIDIQAKGELGALVASLSTTQRYTHLGLEELAKTYESAHPRARKGQDE